MNTHTVRLTSLAHGGGCGCKLAPSVLQQLLADQPAAALYQQLLVGTETSDDAAVWQVDDNTCVIATTDFFMPMVDDPYDFGRIAATNAISDVYAMGGKPIMALAILGMPVDKIPVEMVREILKGGAAVCATAGIPVAGGHSIDCPEPVYGLAVIGICHPSQVRRNSDAKPGDTLILTKPVGVGIYSAAIKKSALPPAAYQEMIDDDDHPQPDRRRARQGQGRARRDRRHRLRRAGPRARAGARVEAVRRAARPADVPLLQAGGQAHRSRASSPARRIATGRATATTSSCRRTCRNGSATCCPTRRPRAACWCPAPPTAPQRS